MRKVKPADVKSSFQALVTEKKSYFVRQETSLKGTVHEMKDLSLLSEMTFHSLYVEFECFISDLVLAYINRDPSAYQRDLFARAKDSVRSKFDDWTASRLIPKTEKNIKIDEIEQLIDPRNFNVTFKDVDALKSNANRWICPAYSAGIAGISAADTRLINTTHSIRDFIAHQSVHSKTNMNNMLRTVDGGNNCHNAGLGSTQNIHNVGSFLKASVGNQRRVLCYADRLLSIAAAL
jgi:hypothetical protein